MMIYFYQNKFLYMYFSKICKLFMSYFVLEATLNGCIRQFFDLTVKLNDRKQSTDPVFVSVRLSDAARRSINQKYLFFKKNTNFRWAFDINIVRCLYFLEYPLSSSLK